jgi:hypothetical protein
MRFRIKETGKILTKLAEDYYEGFGHITKEGFKALGLTLEVYNYEEPQRKLYAYRKLSGEIKFCPIDSGTGWTEVRAPEYDISYE